MEELVPRRGKMRLCPICNSSHSVLLYTMPTTQTVKCCSYCGMVFSDGLPSMDYAQDSIYTSVSTYPAQTGHYEQIVKNCAANKDSFILDVGCATGGLMKTFISSGYKHVSGISLSSGEVAICRKQGLMATVCDVSNPLPEHLDLITLSHVLEHVPDPLPFLRNLRRWIKPTGKVYIEVPDATRYGNRFSSICQGFNSEHINHFDLTHLRFILTEAGFNCAIGGEYVTEDGYPCVWAKCEPCFLEPYSLMGEGECRRWPLQGYVESYCRVLTGQIARVKQHLQNELYGERKIAIWGMGETTRMLLADGTITFDGVIAATDTNPAYHGKFVHGIYVYPPDKFNPIAQYPIIVCSQTHQRDIVSRIMDLGMTNSIIAVEVK